MNNMNFFLPAIGYVFAILFLIVFILNQLPDPSVIAIGESFHSSDPDVKARAAGAGLGNKLSRQLLGITNFLDPKSIDAKIAQPINPGDSNSGGGGLIPFYFEWDHEKQGLGHSFISFNDVVLKARENNLLMRTEFGVNFPPHGLTKEGTRNYFFGDLTMTEIPDGLECLIISKTF